MTLDKGCTVHAVCQALHFKFCLAPVVELLWDYLKAPVLISTRYQHMQTQQSQQLSADLLCHAFTLLTAWLEFAKPV